MKVSVKSGIALAAVAGAAAVAISAARKHKFNLRGWVLYKFIKLLAPDTSDPVVLRDMIAKDRTAGPALPPKKLLATIDFREDTEGDMRVFHVTRKGASDPRLKLLYLHGGGYVFDLMAPQWNLIAGLLERIDAEIIAPIYPLGPEADWRQTTSAIEQHYRAVADRYSAGNVVVAGDSAGGGLALLLAQAMRDQGRPQPAALVLYSPALDLSGSGPDQPALEKRDPILSLGIFDGIATMWLKGLSPEDPRVSPLFADQSDLPPTIIFSGDREILHSDALRLKAANPAVDHRSYPEMIHVFPVVPLREAQQALDETAEFIRLHRRA